MGRFKKAPALADRFRKNFEVQKSEPKVTKPDLVPSLIDLEKLEEDRENSQPKHKRTGIPFGVHDKRDYPYVLGVGHLDKG